MPTKDLEHVLLSEEILNLHRAHASGILEVISGDVTKNIYFKAGRLIFASSSDEQDRLGEQLIRLGRISRAEFAAVYRHSLEHQQRLGETLVDAGLVDGDELGALVARQVQKIVLSLFRFTSGVLHFEESADPIAAELHVDLSLRRLLFEGMRAFPDVARLEQALGDPEQRLRVVTPPPFDIGRVALSPLERDIIRDAGSEMRISDVYARAATRSLLVQGLYALIVGGVLAREDAGAQIDQGVLEGDLGTFQLAITDTHPALHSTGPEAPDVRDQILKRYEALPRATHYDVIGVPRTATSDAINAAYRRLTRQQDEEWSDYANDPQLGSIISTLRLKRRDACLVLCDPIRRAAYDRSLERAAAPHTQAATADSHERAMQLAQSAKRSLERGERDAAISMLLEGVDIDPRDNTCRRLLALTLAQHRTLARRAERHFLTALEIDPHDVELRYRLALYYKKLGYIARAIVHIKAVLGANPGYDEARRELADLERAAATKRSR